MTVEAQKTGPAIDPSEERLARVVMGAGFVLYLAFVIYGSLVPFEFRALTWSEAIRRFSEVRWLRLGIASRADLVANCLLFIPLTFLGQGLLTYARRSFTRQLISGFGLWFGSACLAVGIEFTQVFFAPRTVSLNDIAAESTGALLGIALWMWRGERLIKWVQGTLRTHGPESLAQRLFYGYVVLYAFFQLLPFDLTISPVEVYHQWRDGHVGLLPFQRIPNLFWQGIYELVTDMALFVPIGLLAVKAGWVHGARWRRLRIAALWGLAVSASIEFLQLFVYSRVTDTTDLITGAIGAGVGALLITPGESPRAVLPRRRLSFHWSWLAALLYAFALVFVFWMPFDFAYSKEDLIRGVNRLRVIPFFSYYYSTEFVAISAFLRQFLFFVPLGWLLYVAAGQWPKLLRRVVFLGFTLAIATLVELGQLFLPSRIADNTDILIGWLGAIAGLAMAKWLRNRFGSGHVVDPSVTQDVTALVDERSSG